MDQLKLIRTILRKKGPGPEHGPGPGPEPPLPPVDNYKPIVDKNGCSVRITNKTVSVYDTDGKALKARKHY